jgi:acyl-CoA synthetase (AMP-forming)/AMP-acid ligase II
MHHELDGTTPSRLRVGTVGRALRRSSGRIVSPETGEVLPVGEIGEFVARGYNIMKGYYKMPGATRSAIDAEGWLHTGDLACETPEGNYRITGRLKDMIIRGGENIYPKEIEEFLYTHPKVKDVQVIGVPSEHYGEEIMAASSSRRRVATEQEIQDYVRRAWPSTRCRSMWRWWMLPDERGGQDYEIQNARGRDPETRSAKGRECGHRITRGKRVVCR